MLKNRAYVLSKLLSEEETLRFVNFPAMQRNERMQLLFKALRKQAKSGAGKEAIYKQVYQEDYLKEKDYLLRNDLRKLSQLLHQFMLKEVTESGDSIHYFELLLERKALGIFEKDISKQIKKLKAQKNENLYACQKLWFEYILKYKPRKENDLKAYRQLFADAIESIEEKHYFFKTHFIILLAVLERITWQYYKIEFTDLDSLLDKTVVNSDKLFSFHFEKAKSYQCFGEERISQLNKCLDVLTYVKSSQIDKEVEAAYLQSQLGLEFFLKPAFEQSKKHYEIAYEHFDILSESQRIQLIYNYTSMLCAKGEFPRVFTLLDMHLHLFEGTPYKPQVSFFLLMAHIHTDRLANLRTILPDLDENATKDSQVYWRVYECIVLYYEENYELALSFLENIYNTARYHKDLDKAFVGLARLFKHFISALMLLDKAQKKERLQEVKVLSDEFINSYELGFGSNMLCSVWLNKEIAKRAQLV